MAALLVLGLAPAAVITYVDIQRVYKLSEDAAHSSIETVFSMKKKSIENYFANLVSVAETMALNPVVINSVGEFATAAKDVDRRMQDDPGNAALSERYKYQGDNTPGATEADVARWRDLDPLARKLQQLYISDNAQNIGEKHLLQNAGDNSLYSNLHAWYHPYFTATLEEFGFYDIFLLDPVEGRVVYSVFKELDYGTSFLTGPYKASAFGRGVDAIITGGQRTTQMIDFEPYEPSYGADAAFVLVPLMDGSTLKGIIAFQAPVDRINAIVNTEVKGFESSETLLLGDNRRLRAAPRLSTDLTIGSEVDSETINLALAGEGGFIRGENHVGTDSFASYGRLDIPGYDWVMVTGADSAEALAEADAAVTETFYKFGIIALVIVAAGFVLGTSLLRPVRRLGKEFQESVVSSMDSLNGAAEQSKAAAESMASMAEQTSAQGAVVKENSVAAAEKVSGTAAAVEQMSASIQEIAGGVTRTSTLSEDATTKAAAATASLEELQEATARISNVVKFINGITAQTDLLALNAAVEAARAGEAGRGFAVVAEEVRKLAEQTAASTIEIRKEIDAVTSGVETNVEAIREISEAVAAVQNQASNMSSAAEQQGGVTVEMSNSMADLSNRVDNVSRNIIGVEESSSVSAKAASDVMNQMFSVDDAAANTNDAIKSFLQKIERL